MANTNAHTHERSCISCRQKAAKTDLLRIVRTKDGIAFDASGKAAGRGAYVCSTKCFETARAGLLSRALKTNVSEDEAQAVAQAIQAHMQTN